MPLMLIAAFALLSTVEAMAAPSVNLATPFAELDEAEMMARIENMGCLFPVKLTREVKDQIYRYTESYKKGSGEILGRAEMYFPLFDQYLEEAGIPQELKYLAIVESALKPSAVSSAGAAGLWQFMRTTGRQYGLEINRAVDQRRDPHRSTQSATKYLKDLYHMFGDWSLALAAYNSGPGRVKQAIQRGNSTDFWKIKRYLPKETRNYVPAFIAATYLVNYYYLHGIEPALLEDDLVFTSSIIIYEKLNFSKISEWTGLPLSMIKQLNPGYIRNYIPHSANGQYLTLPNTVIHRVASRLEKPDQAQWVGVMPTLIPEDLELDENAIIVAESTAERTISAQVEPLQALPSLDITRMSVTSLNDCENENGSSGLKQPARHENEVLFVYYRLKRGQSLSEIADIKGLPVEDLIALNRSVLNERKNLTGTYIRIPSN